MSEYYPAHLNIEGRRCVVVGGGQVAERKVKSLLRCGGQVTVISLELSPPLRKLWSSGQIDFVERGYCTGDLDGAFIVVAATSDLGINARVAEEAESKGKLVNVVDAPDRGNFIVPSVVRRGDLLVGVSTHGRSPALARKLRAEIERVLLPEYESLLELVAEVRHDIGRNGLSVDSEAWQDSLDAELLELLKSGLTERAKSMLISSLQRHSMAASETVGGRR